MSMPRGRPKSVDPTRTIRLPMFLTPDEHQELTTAAREAFTTAGHFARMTLFQQLREKHKNFTRTEVEA